MIDGLKVQFSSDELTDHLRLRVDHHTRKARFYAEQADALEDAGERPNNVTNDPVRSLRDSQDSHARRAEYFQVLVDHLIPNETYRIADSDLTRIELVSGYL